MFGEFSRYRLDECRSRFGNIVYMVFDAERPDGAGLATLIRHENTREAAMAGLN
jgi:hypothetical protein